MNITVFTDTERRSSSADIDIEATTFAGDAAVIGISSTEDGSNMGILSLTRAEALALIERLAEVIAYPPGNAGEGNKQ